MRPGPELVARNRRRTARLEGWPGGAVETCERVAAKHPDWTVTWTAGFRYGPISRPPGFRAWRHGTSSNEALEVQAATEAGLVAAIELMITPLPRQRSRRTAADLS